MHLIKKHKLYTYDGYYGSWIQFAHHAQRLLNPLIYLDDEKDVMSFLENKPELYPMDYLDGILNKGLKFESNVDHYVKWLGKNTRVVAFYHGKEEYKDDINELRKVAEMNSNRLNLRIAYVTDTNLIAKLKKKNKHLFFDKGMSSMVLVRYDGLIQKLDLADSPITQYN